MTSEVLLDREIDRPQPLEGQKLALGHAQRRRAQALHHLEATWERAICMAVV